MKRSATWKLTPPSCIIYPGKMPALQVTFWLTNAPSFGKHLRNWYNTYQTLKNSYALYQMIISGMLNQTY
jgi:hypothetical protein